MINKKRAIVLLNLGGPDCLDAVQPFLFNLFNDKAIISLPNPFRWVIAKIISSKRAPIAKEIYSHMGGKSTIMEETVSQSNKLEKMIKENGGEFSNSKVFISMRYWKPFSSEVVEKLEKFDPEEILLLPLYPQFSTTTTESSIVDFKKKLSKSKKLKNILVKSVGCYFFEEDFIKSHVNLIKEKYDESKNQRILFSAHGLPEKVINSGDPYQNQVEKTVKLIVENLNIKNLDYVICYQSRVGPLKWIDPNTEDEIIKAGEEKKSIMLVPVAFVSEHSETLVELDIEYKEVADKKGVVDYCRVPTLSSDDLFIKSLFNIVINSFKNKDLQGVFSADGKRKCDSSFSRCICKNLI